MTSTLSLLPVKLPTDPLRVFEGLVSRHKHCFLLETLAGSGNPDASGPSYIGVAPAHHFAVRQGMTYKDGKIVDAPDPDQYLRQQLSHESKSLSGYAGGLVGYASHEAYRYAEPTLDVPSERDFQDFEYGQYDDGLIFEPGKPPEYFYYGKNRSDIYGQKPAEPAKLTISFKRTEKNKTQYEEMVKSALKDISDGRVFQVVLANKYEYNFEGDLIRLYRRLREINPSQYMFFIKFGNTVTMGASPELLLHTDRKREVHLEALAGTIRRSENTSEDKILAGELLGDEKEIAEHNMLVDLVRNDLGRVSRIGSVKIDNLMYIKRLSHVQHICSLVSGKLETGYDAFDGMAAVFPAGTLVGAPKLEAAKMINELEGCERGPYGGAVGYYSYSGESMHAVNIRSVSAVGNRLFMHSGSGIVHDSSPEYERAEIDHKKAAMDKAMAPFMREHAL